jgi:hypothetical protein
MVDFCNPVFSPRRAQLLHYVPASVAGTQLGAALETEVVTRLKAAIADGSHAADAADSPEREFLANWETADFDMAFSSRIGPYLQALQANAGDADAVDGWFRLAEYRRRLFRRRKLFEFKLTTPQTTIPANAPPLRMTPLGRVETALNGQA